MKFEAPQIIMIALILIGLVTEALERETKDFVSYSIAAVMAAGLLYWGGFFG